VESKKRDLIDRGQINYTWWELPDGKFSDGVTLQSVIHSMPTVDAVEAVHGRWIHDINNLYGCSECMERETMSPKKLKKYCPNCGARMDGDKHE
jgi:hypothetical protein